jgi:hypothetical protein
MHYAAHSYQDDIELQIVEKARDILWTKVIDTRYMREKATDELVLDVLGYFINLPRKELPDRGSEWRKFENFLNMANGRDKREIRFLIPVLIFRFAENKKAIRKLWEIRQQS